jgi:hypothetical protein
MISSRSRHTCGYRLAYAWRFSVGGLCEELSYGFESCDGYTPDAMHVVDNTGVDVCSSTCSIENARG